MRAAVVVVGDLGRSSRMQYDVRALAANGVDVDLISHAGATVARSLTYREHHRGSAARIEDEIPSGAMDADVRGAGGDRCAEQPRTAGTQWLDPEDDPRSVGSADVGLCLHGSSSGVDIPMKIADLFGAGAPVCALDYGVGRAERLPHGGSGLLFLHARPLAELLFDLFEACPADSPLLDRLRQWASRSARPTWEEGWSNEAREDLLPG